MRQGCTTRSRASTKPRSRASVQGSHATRWKDDGARAERRAVRGAPELGSEIAGYRMGAVLGEGGMGTVYLARSPQGGLCALKVLSTQLLGADPSFATRFKREVQYA